MMPKELPNVMNDKGYQKDARDFAKKMMACNGILYLHIPADTRSAFPVISVQSPVSIQCCWQS